MRGNFNDVCNIRYGPRSVVGVPLDVWATDVPCRKVPQHEISQHQSPLDLSAKWFTFDSVAAHGPRTLSPWLGAMFDDYLAADQVVFLSEPGVWYVVCREELVVPTDGTPYSRFLLIPLSKVAYPFWPPPEPLPGPPVPGPLTYVPPGGSCADPRVLTSFGDYLFSTQLDGTNGYYAFVFSPGESVRLFPIGGVGPDVANDVFETDVHGNGCAGTFLGQISTSGVGCVSTTPPITPPARKIVWSVAAFGMPIGPFLTIGMRIENAVC